MGRVTSVVDVKELAKTIVIVEDLSRSHKKHDL